MACDDVGERPTCRRAVLRRPQRLVRCDARTRRHAADRREACSGGVTGRLNAEVAAGGRRRVRTVAVVVAWRRELPRQILVDALVAALCGVEVPRRDELVVAVRRGPLLAGLAGAAEARDLVGIVVSVRPVELAIRERLALGPGARIDDTDDLVLAGALSRPPWETPPSWSQSPPLTSRPRKCGVDDVLMACS